MTRSKKQAYSANIILSNEGEEVTFSEQDGKFKPLSAAQILENVLITGKSTDNSVLGVLVQESVDEVKQLIKSNIRSFMLAAIGFETDSYDRRIRVDHCNGRMSAVTEYLSEYTKDFVSKSIEEYIKKNEENIKKTIHAAISSEIKSTLANNSHYNSVRSKLAEMAQSIIDSEMDKLVEEKLLIQQVVERSLTSSLLAKATSGEISQAKEAAKYAKRRR